MSNTHVNYAPRLGIVERWQSRIAGLLLAPVWLVAALGIAIPLFTHALWVLAVVGLSAIALGVVLGGGDRSSGSEEYAMALPPSRHEQYWIKALLGLVIPLSACLGIAILELDLSAKFWGLFCSSGWAASASRGSDALMCSAIVIPTALFVMAYAGATLGGIPAGLLSVLVVGAVCGGSAIVESRLWQSPNGTILLPAVGVLGALVLLGAYPVYLRRDTASLAQRGQTGAIVVLISLIIVLLLGFLLFAGVGEARRVETNQMEADTDVTVIELKSSIPPEGGAE
jgi:hypothetical protein